MSHGEIVNPGKSPKRKEPKVLGANPVPPVSAVKRLDSRSPAKPVEIEMTNHGDLVTVRSHVRSKPLRKGEPDVRVRAMTPEQKKAWQKARKG